MKTHTVETAAELLAVDPTTIRALIDDGKLPAAKIGRSYVMLETDLEEYVRQQINIQHSEQMKSPSAITLANLHIITQEEILRNKMPANMSASIYFLINENQIVYVGKSINPTRRLGEHTHSKKFDSYLILPCMPNDAAVIEAHFIKLFSPPLNEAGKK